jgi:hypothetical protein
MILYFKDPNISSPKLLDNMSSYSNVAGYKTPCISINSKWIKDLNIRPDILQSIQERAGSTLNAIGISKDFISRTQMAQ